jgi:hypothetical protein
LINNAIVTQWIAFRRKNEAMTPFIATSSQLNLGYIGRGYDIYNGNPLSDDGVVELILSFISAQHNTMSGNLSFNNNYIRLKKNIHLCLLYLYPCIF